MLEYKVYVQLKQIQFVLIILFNLIQNSIACPLALENLIGIFFYKPNSRKNFPEFVGYRCRRIVAL